MPSTNAGSETGNVGAISIRRSHAHPPERIDKVQLIAGVGMAEDVHAHSLSPRQLLIADVATYADLHLPEHALRENLLITWDVSKLRSGTVLQIGDAALLRLTFQCEACGHLNDHVTKLSALIGHRRGVLARVIRSGVIQVGDRVVDIGLQTPPWSDDWRKRVGQVLDCVPDNMVVEYKQLAFLSGISASYCRVLQRMIRDFGMAYCGKAVSKSAALDMPRWDGTDLFRDSDGP